MHVRDVAAWCRLVTWLIMVAYSLQRWEICVLLTSTLRQQVYSLCVAKVVPQLPYVGRYPYMM